MDIIKYLKQQNANQNDEKQDITIKFAILEMLNNFTGKLKDGDKNYKGKFDIPNLSEENDTDEIDVSEALISYA